MAAATAAVAAAVPSPAAFQPGLFPVQADRDGAHARIRLPRADADGVLGRYLYQPSIAGGLGATGVGLDRAALGATQVLALRRVGNKVLAQFENHRFRAVDADRGEAEAVRASFLPSTVWSGEIAAEQADGSVLVDLAGFLQRDAVDIAGRLKKAGQGSYKPAPALGYIDPAQVLAFPDNVEFETVQTFVADEPGSDVARVAPDAHALTFTVHHSFIRLPGPGFAPRPHDPRSGTSAQVLVTDYAADLERPVVSRLARRFRLQKTDPGAARSPVVKPIVYYMDRAAPESIRNALMEGARWWAQAFDAAGFVDAFRVELLPEGVNPADARYNVINWIHRESRGWSTGYSVVDPRTGEIVRGVVQLGSLRVRQDQMIFRGLLGTAGEGGGGADDPIELAHARLRQLAVHEVGHTLGLAHNFAGSSYADRASVMDYPAPRVRVQDGRLDLSDAYARGVGAWDRFAIDWLYRQFPAGTDEAAALSRMAAEAQARGYRFVTDADTRGVGDAQPYGNMWDDGEDAVAGLANALQVRDIALRRFGADSLPDGTAMAELRRVVVPIYLFHRYQVAAAAKLIGGVDYAYAVKGDGHGVAATIPAARQQAALEGLLAALQPQVLDLPDRVIELLSSMQSGVPDRQYEIELLPSRGGRVFDLPSAAETAADVVFDSLLAPERLNRLAEQARRDPAQLSLPQLLDRIGATLAPGQRLPARQQELQRRVRARYAAWLASVLEDRRMSSTALASVRGAAQRFGERLRDCRGDALETDHCRYLADMLTGAPAQLRALAEPIAEPEPIPPGAPIGSREECWFCSSRHAVDPP
ncbi:zinc-dependent metalloprotease [Stenotrophomonas sp. MMGLT7]|uniref:zinc-dependent metalloprotease n=1 Tax=Stenotrophomonas sp. MMGLT7 TaxID=2901227 RepID=UPI001E2BB6FB|nr:zinc-dependent metalloprotease [Stenotrophomonas sp. MMGLT7]MCD7098476.1 zinc-dependent metalloprotease [Stenotrophomonas sp. MMGLT7]